MVRSYLYLFISSCIVYYSSAKSPLRFDPGPCPCPDNADTIDVTLAVNNALSRPPASYEIILRNRPKDVLIRHLEHAADKAKIFSFSADYDSNFGYLITAINKYAADPAAKTYWETIGPNGPLSVGVSTYVPADDSRIIFNFTRDAH